jgi:hypothetical protein
MWSSTRSASVPFVAGRPGKPAVVRRVARQVALFAHPGGGHDVHLRVGVRELWKAIVPRLTTREVAACLALAAAACSRRCSRRRPRSQRPCLPRCRRHASSRRRSSHHRCDSSRGSMNRYTALKRSLRSHAHAPLESAEEKPMVRAALHSAIAADTAIVSDSIVASHSGKATSMCAQVGENGEDAPVRFRISRPGATSGGSASRAASTVRSATKSRAAIARAERPPATRPNTSNSRWVSSASGS